MTTAQNTTKYRGTCTCGWKGRTMIDGNGAIEAMERHLDSKIKREGTVTDNKGIKHLTDVEEVE